MFSRAMKRLEQTIAVMDMWDGSTIFWSRLSYTYTLRRFRILIGSIGPPIGQYIRAVMNRDYQFNENEVANAQNGKRLAFLNSTELTHRLREFRMKGKVLLSSPTNSTECLTARLVDALYSAS